MPMINLLPWRAELRQKRKKEFLMATLGAVLMGAALTFGSKMFVQAQISNQESRNSLLRAEIAELDKRIEEIRELESRKARLLARMEIIEQLQTSRPEAVHLMDEAVNIMPEGTHLTEIRQTGARVEIVGIAQSSTRVSALMNNIDDSEWLKDPDLRGIDYRGTGANLEGEFTLFANQIRMNEDEESLQ